MNVLETYIEELTTLLKTNEHTKDKQIAQTAWDLYLKILRFTSLLDNNQQIFMNKAKRILLGNKKWI
jgi:hypothetical protein|tara:strand:+ start:67 stop:267 length:201 start_codon:yes stop_codon:yes gene_type:complete